MQKTINLKFALQAALQAARTVGVLMRKNLDVPKRANEITHHDIKLELDVRSQKLIEKTLRAAFPDIALLGEEGVLGDPKSEYRWVVDPIDGTVNYAYTIPHAAVSIALQRRALKAGPTTYEDGYDTILGVVYDPFLDEMWTALAGQPARLNGKVIRVSPRTKLAECIICIGFAKDPKSLEATLPYFNHLAAKVRKIRITGSAAISLSYVASGRFDAYIEAGIHLWDVAAAGFILERAGGEFWREALPSPYAYRMLANNGLVRRRLSIPGR